MKDKEIIMKRRSLRENICQKMEDTPIDKFSSLFLLSSFDFINIKGFLLTWQ
jgi:hypothetical protein